MLLRVEQRLPAGARLARAHLARAERLCLGYEDRRRSRLRTRLDSGEEIALLLPRGTVLRDADLLLARDGRLIRVIALAEAVLEVHAEPSRLTRIAYHLGNRHVAVELGCGWLRLAEDAVLADLLQQLGVEPRRALAAFEPESGAYGGGHRHAHAESFEEDSELAKERFAAHWGEEPATPGAPPPAVLGLSHAQHDPQNHAGHPAHHHPHHHPHHHAQTPPQESQGLPGARPLAAAAVSEPAQGAEAHSASSLR